MLNSFSRVQSLALFTTIVTAVVSHQASGQSIELQWQQTASNKDRSLTQFDQYAIEGDFQAVLLGVERRHYHISENDEQRVDHLHRLKVGVQYYTKVSEHYAIWPRFQIMAGYDNHISSDSLTYNPQLVGIRELTENFSLVVGTGALIHTAENQYYPVFGLVLNPSDDSRWSGNLTVPQGDIAYRINETWSAEAGLNWQTRYYRTDAAESGAQFMRTKDILLSLGARANLNAHLRLSGHLTYAFERENRFYTSTARITEKPSSGLGFRLLAGYDF